MQYGRALDFPIREVVIANPALVPIYILKSDISNVFPLISLIPIDAPNLGLVLLSYLSGEEMVAIPLTLPIEWKNSPTILCMAPDKVADLENAALCCNQPSHKHKLYDRAEALVITDSPPL